MKRDRARLKALAMNREIPDQVFRRIVIMAIDARGYHETFVDALDRLEGAYFIARDMARIADQEKMKNNSNYLLQGTKDYATM